MVLTVPGDVAEPGVGQRNVDTALERFGRIDTVNISTSLVDHANSQVLSALASLTKGGLNAVTKALAVEYSDRGIRADTVALGVIRTPMHDPSSYDTLAKLHLAGRLDEIDDVVDAQEPECVVDAFTDAAIFQGLHPYSVGRQAVAAYYAAQPRGIAVWDLILKTRSPSNDLVLGYVSALFTFPEPPTATDAEICRKGSS